MHITLGILASVITFIFILNRLSKRGFDIGWFNPIRWYRRHQYPYNPNLNPAYKQTSPLHSTALLLVTIAKADGDMSKEQKAVLLAIFEDKFHLSTPEASELMRSAVFLFGDGNQILENPERIVERSLDNFTEEQLQSMQQLMQTVAEAEGEPSYAQQQVIKQISKVLPTPNQVKWH